LFTCWRQSATDDSKAGSAAPAKINEFRNKFEKFGAPAAAKFPTRKPPTGPGAPATAASVTTGSSEAVDKASKEARDLAAQLQQQMTQLEQSRVNERQQLLEKLDSRDAQLKTISDKNAAVSSR